MIAAAPNLMIQTPLGMGEYRLGIVISITASWDRAR